MEKSINKSQKTLVFEDLMDACYHQLNFWEEELIE